ncbi:pyridoxal phosphate-dependent aminotransferase [Phenylobacterium sp.]|uniref:pyridoxal phosphate-dependent aminotransferase n=1 Tax=Phenylobacterium sp. TaxID=1871053 RepID=UPI002FDB37BC
MTFERAADRRDALAAPPETYTRWVRTTLARVAGEADAGILFDSTISEPTELLAGVVRRAFNGQVTDRYESVFSAGNRYVARAVAARYGVAPTQVIAATGATSAMAMAIRAFVRRGDHVVVESPCFDLLPALAREAGAEVSFVSRPPPAFDLDPAALQAALRPNTALVLLTQLHNPSGARLSPDALEALATVTRKAGVPLLVDEVYADFAGPEASAWSGVPGVMVANSLTKVHGLFALKCGWLVGSPDHVARVEAANPQGDLGVSKLAHAVAALVLEDLAPFEAHWRSVLDRSRAVMARHAEAMRRAGLIEGALPQDGCMFFPRICGVSDTLALAEQLWTQDHLAVAPGEHFGLGGHIRLGFGGDAEALDRGLARLSAALAARVPKSAHS